MQEAFCVRSECMHRMLYLFGDFERQAEFQLCEESLALQRVAHIFAILLALVQRALSRHRVQSRFNPVLNSARPWPEMEELPRATRVRLAAVGTRVGQVS